MYVLQLLRASPKTFAKCRSIWNLILDELKFTKRLLIRCIDSLKSDLIKIKIKTKQLTWEVCEFNIAFIFSFWLQVVWQS